MQDIFLHVLVFLGEGMFMKYIDFKVKYTAEELYQYEKSYLFKKYFSMYSGLPGIIIACAFAYFAVMAYLNGIQNVNKLALVAFGILVLLFLLVLVRALYSRLTYKKRYEGNGSLDEEKRIVLSIDGEYPNDLGDTPVYSQALDFFETKSIFVVEVGYAKARRVLVIPKRYCSDEKIREFIRDCAARMIQNRKDMLKKK